MKKSILLLMIVLLTFGGGFISGVLYSSKKSTAEDVLYTIENTPQSVKNLDYKAAPQAKTHNPKVLIGYVQDFRNPDEIEY